MKQQYLGKLDIIIAVTESVGVACIAPLACTPLLAAPASLLFASVLTGVAS